MLESIKNEELSFQELTPEEKSKRGILGRLTGPIASYVKSTRNSRKYSEALWDKAFQSPLVKEMFANGGLIGQLEHPETTESDPMKAAIIMRDPPKKDTKGHLVASVDILDTPCGKIAYALAKAGFKFGISSRGEGELFTNARGEEEVDPDSYELTTFDLVALPACEDARLTFTESYHTNKAFDYKSALKEAVCNASEKDKILMLETLDKMNIDIASTEEEEEQEDSDTSTDDIDLVIAAENDGAGLVGQLQEALMRNAELEKKLSTVQKNLSACYTREQALKESISNYKDKIAKISDLKRSEEALKSRVQSLSEALSEAKNKVSLAESVSTSLNNAKSEMKVYKESLIKKDSELQMLKDEISSLNEELESSKRANDAEITQLKESIAGLKKDSAIKNKQYSESLQKAQNLAKKYKTIATTAVNHYIESKANMLGVSAYEIKSKLGESYSFSDIDKVCDSFQRYKLNTSNLPFALPDSNAKMTITESKKPSILNNSQEDDDLDEQFLAMAKLNF